MIHMLGRLSDQVSSTYQKTSNVQTRTPSRSQTYQTTSTSSTGESYKLFTVGKADGDFRSWTANLGDAGRLQPRPPAPANLRPATKEFGAYNFGRPRVPSIYGGSSSSRRTPQDGESSSHLDSADFSGIDLGLQLDDMDMSIEQGRHESVRPERLGMSRDRSIGYRTGSVDFGAQGGMDVTFDSVDLGLDFGGGMELPELEGRSRRESEYIICDRACLADPGEQRHV